MTSDRRVAVVTGGGSGMGRAIVHRLAADGLAVAVVDIDADAADQIVAEVRATGNAEFGPKGITVNTVPPGFIDTPMLRESERRGMFGDSVDHHIGLTPVRRAGRPEDIAAACSFLFSDEAGYIRGQVVGVNGGRST
jgi:NAD(P)-dependent dehydrogenase (short-subunit alcohol dehydrogenase family)